MANEDLRARLREEPAPVRYDLARGLARHRALIEAGTQLPEWASELPVRRTPWLRRLAVWGGTLTVLTTLTMLWPRTSSEPVALPMPVPTVEVLPAREASTRRAPTPQPLVVESAVSKPTHEPAEVAVSPEATPEAQEHADAIRTRRTRTKRQASASESDSVAQSARNPRVVAPQDNVELQQLVEAERALSFDPVRALRLAREGELSFRNGYFAQERHYVEVMALFALGRLGEAHAQAAAFLRDYPNAPYRRKVELELLRQPQH